MHTLPSKKAKKLNIKTYEKAQAEIERAIAIDPVVGEIRDHVRDYFASKDKKSKH